MYARENKDANNKNARDGWYCSAEIGSNVGYYDNNGFVGKFDEYDESVPRCAQLMVRGTGSAIERPVLSREHDYTRFFTVHHTLYLERLTLKGGGGTNCAIFDGGSDQGSAIHVDTRGSLTLSEVTFKENRCGLSLIHI